MSGPAELLAQLGLSPLNGWEAEANPLMGVTQVRCLHGPAGRATRGGRMISLAAALNACGAAGLLESGTGERPDYTGDAIRIARAEARRARLRRSGLRTRDTLDRDIRDSVDARRRTFPTTEE